jgi:hypothetical protein
MLLIRPAVRTDVHLLVFLCAQNFEERKLAMRCLRMLQPPLATRRVLGSC